MTGTAVAVGDQLREFYKLEVAVIPSNTPCIREDEPDRIYAQRRRRRTRAIVDEIAEIARHGAAGAARHAGRRRVRASWPRALRAAEVECVVLNAKNDAEEAAIIAEAGERGAVTVSTQMAGRGIDIRLGGRAWPRARLAACT